MNDIFSKESLQELAGDCYKDMIEIYLSKSGSLIEKLNKTASDEYLALEHIGHSIKGSAAQICAVTLNEVAAELERAAKNSDLAKLELLSETIKDEYDKLIETLKQELDTK
ncbi:MAG: Hpt domain-containing protein [Nitrospinota bacterium]